MKQRNKKKREKLNGLKRNLEAKKKKYEMKCIAKQFYEDAELTTNKICSRTTS